MSAATVAAMAPRGSRARRWVEPMPFLLRLCALWFVVLVAGAQAAHVTDKLLVGLYAEPGSTGKPLKLLASGTPLDVLQHTSGFTQVRVADDTQGWIEAEYVSEEKPARAMLLEAQARLRETTEELNRLKAEAGDGDAQRAIGSASVPSAREAQLRRELEKAATRIQDLQQQVGDRPRVEALQEQLDQLQERVDRAGQILGVPAVDGESRESLTGGELIGRYQLWIAATVAVIVGFVAGVAFFDYRIRKRYGGFRI